jgi:hypothetical protein
MLIIPRWLGFGCIDTSVAVVPEALLPGIRAPHEHKLLLSNNRKWMFLICDFGADNIPSRC